MENGQALEGLIADPPLGIVEFFLTSARGTERDRETVDSFASVLKSVNSKEMDSLSYSETARRVE
jgi:hypothetical protein